MQAATLQDSRAIPAFAQALQERFIRSLGPFAVFSAFWDTFSKAKLPVHRKSIIYVVHEAFMRSRKEGSFEQWRPSCVGEFLLKAGKLVRKFKEPRRQKGPAMPSFHGRAPSRRRGAEADERSSYCKVAAEWKKRKCLKPAEFEQLKDSWDLD
ncbi:unnamed protein product [Prorocentrum cordatum]|uniref:Uncharacterized protein n=1 Tax=Prorocentrum cordatum TaxID=2364126 RepID=A0ABN9TV82_9DINO|nr:unnamed protein product [Polarella glacialis]